jgi:hypothetical protein
MSICRTYFDKDTIIVRNSCVNTGRNPIAEIFHGGSKNIDLVTFSRYIFNIDLTNLIQKVDNKELFIDRMTHKINLTNTSYFDRELYCKTVVSSCGEVQRATGFDLILFEVPEIWDEGNGYDYIVSKSLGCTVGDNVYCEGPSNWFDREFNTTWSQPGVYTDPTMWWSGSTTGYTGTTVDLIVGTQHFDHGDENLCIDITGYVNNLISSGITQLNLGIAYEPSQEIVPQDCICYVGFFTRETQTVYEPFMETQYNDSIKDDRDNFFLDKSNRLCLYVNAGGERVNANISEVSIYDQNDNVYQIISNTGITQITTGVYCVDVNVDGNPVSGYCGNVQFRDVWENVTINSHNVGDVELDFIVQDSSNYYNIGSTNSAGAFGLGVSEANNRSIYDYEFAVHGIKRREKIKRGDTRRVDVKARIPLTFNQTQAVDKIYYRIFIKEGETQIDYIDWNEVNRTPDGNFFLVDTSWFIPNDYFMEIKIESGNQIRTYNDVIQFEIVSEKDWC